MKRSLFLVSVAAIAVLVFAGCEAAGNDDDDIDLSGVLKVVDASDAEWADESGAATYYRHYRPTTEIYGSGWAVGQPDYTYVAEASDEDTSDVFLRIAVPFGATGSSWRVYATDPERQDPDTGANVVNFTLGNLATPVANPYNATDDPATADVDESLAYTSVDVSIDVWVPDMVTAQGLDASGAWFELHVAGTTRGANESNWPDTVASPADDDNDGTASNNDDGDPTTVDPDDRADSLLVKFEANTDTIWDGTGTSGWQTFTAEDVLIDVRHNIVDINIKAGNLNDGTPFVYYVDNLVVTNAQ